MSYPSRISALHLIALLLGGSAISQSGVAHSEGILAADPSTPAALLRFEGAVTGYTRPSAVRLQWRGLFGGRAESREPMTHHTTGSNAPSGHTDSNTAMPATMHQ